MRLFLDKSPKWQYAVLSMHKDSRLAVELESSFFYGHCNYLTLEQLRKINQVCPELFRRKKE
jgi:hypothetical protein